MAYLYKPKKSQYWWYKVYANGQYIRESSGETKKSLAKVVATKKELEYKSDPSDIRISRKGKILFEAAEEYLCQGKFQWSETHFIKQRNYFKYKFLPYFKPHTNVKHIRDLHIRQYLMGRLKEGISESTYNRELTSLKTFFKFCTENGWLSKNPAFEIKQLRENQAAREYYTKEECEKILSVDHPNIHFFWIQYFCGLRPNETLNLKWEDIDFKNNTLYVISRKEGKTKTKRSRAIPLHQQLAEKLLTILRPINTEFVVCKPDGTKYARYGYRDFVKRICALAGVRHRASYPMRHTFGTYMAENDPRTEKLGRWMGHTNPYTTQQYIHPVVSSDFETMSKYSIKLLKPIKDSEKTPYSAS